MKLIPPVGSYINLNILASLQDSIRSKNGAEDVDATTEGFQEQYQDHYEMISNSDPFSFLLEFVLHAGFMNISESKIKLLLNMMRVVLHFKEQDPNMEMPSDRSILKYYIKKTSKLPKMTPTKHTVCNKQGEQHDFNMNKPSEYLRCLMSDPTNNSMLSTLPDETEDSEQMFN